MGVNRTNDIVVNQLNSFISGINVKKKQFQTVCKDDPG